MSDAQEELRPAWAKFTRITDPSWEPGRYKFAWADGATLVAEYNGDIGDFFQRHPYFERAEAIAADSLEQAIRVWLSHREPPPQDATWRHRELPASRDLPFPDDFFTPPLPTQVEGRPCDLWLSGALDPGYDIFAVHPDVEALWYVWSDGDGPHEDAWNAKIWLRRRG